MGVQLLLEVTGYGWFGVVDGMDGEGRCSGGFRSRRGGWTPTKIPVRGVGFPALRGFVGGYQEVIKLGFGIGSSIRSTCNL